MFSTGDDHFSKIRVGTPVFGDLKNFGFVVVRAPKPTKALNTYVKKARNQFANRSPDIGNKNRKLLFPLSVSDKAKGLDDDKTVISKFVTQIMTKVVHPMFDAEFSPSKVNFIYNAGNILYPQRPHSDYKNSYPPEEQVQKE